MTSGLIIGTRLDSHVPLSFQQITWRNGSVYSARFAPDGHSVVYGAAWEGGPRELFVSQVGSADARSLGVLDAEILAVSKKGDVAIGQGLRYGGSLEPNESLLSTMTLSGAAPRAILESVRFADWSSDGRELAVARRTRDGTALEYPVGKTLFKTSGFIGFPKVSPDRRYVAFVHHSARPRKGALTVVSTEGIVKRLSGELYRPRGVAWSSSGEEIWFTSQDAAGGTPIYAVALNGRMRVVERLPGWAVLQDIAADGRALVTRDRIRGRVFIRTPELNSDREVSWLDATNVTAFSVDRRSLLLTEAAAGGGQAFSTYIRRIDGSPAVRLGEGWGVALSPDQRLAIVYSIANERLLTIPTGAGAVRELENRGIKSYSGGVNSGWLPDGRLVFDARASDDIIRLFIQDVHGGDPQPTKVVTNGAMWALAPDGTRVVVDTLQDPEICSLSTGATTPLRKRTPADRVISWNRDGIFVRAKEEGVSAVVDRINPENADRLHWRTLSLPERVGVEPAFDSGALIADAGTYSYGFLQVLSELVVVSGLK